MDELDVIYTNHAEQYDFASKKTFALPDKVIKITGEDNKDEEPEFVDPIYGNTIISALRDNMTFIGYKEVDAESNPDLILLPAAFQTDQVYFYYDWYYWNWFYPGWGSGWGWYYPGYYPPQVTRIRTGTVMIQMTVPGEQDATDKIPVIWTGVVNGLLEGSTSSINARINTTIEQAFIQSPYLAK